MERRRRTKDEPRVIALAAVRQEVPAGLYTAAAVILSALMMVLLAG